MIRNGLLKYYWLLWWLDDIGKNLEELLFKDMKSGRSNFSKCKHNIILSWLHIPDNNCHKK